MVCVDDMEGEDGTEMVGEGSWWMIGGGIDNVRILVVGREEMGTVNGMEAGSGRARLRSNEAKDGELMVVEVVENEVTRGEDIHM